MPAYVRPITFDPKSYVVQCCLMIAQDLRESLVCPECKKALAYRQNPESLKCGQCHRAYAVKDDIPIMLVDEAKVES